jgi:uncharacterized membrane protein (UPF0127 family)
MDISVSSGLWVMQVYLAKWPWGLRQMAGQAIVTVNGSTWDVYLANTYAELAQGLAGVVSMSAGTGMIFDTGYDHAIGVTTEQMLFSLDIAFVSSELKVVEIHSNVAPGAVLAGSEPARYFLEVNAGELAAVSIGDDVSIEVVSTPVYVAPAISSEDIVNMAVMIGAAIVFSGLAWEMMGVGPYGHEYGGRHERGVVTPSADEDVWVRDGEQMLVSKHAEDYELMWLEGEGWRRARPEEWPYRGSS